MHSLQRRKDGATGVQSPVNPHLEAQQRRSGAAGDKLQELALLLVCEAFDHFPKDLDDGVIG